MILKHPVSTDRKPVDLNEGTTRSPGSVRKDLNIHCAGLEAQIGKLKPLGAKIFAEHVQCQRRSRSWWRPCPTCVNDTFIICSADRLAQNTIDLLNIVDDLTAWLPFAS